MKEPGIKLINGDCLLEMQEIPSKSIDMVLADPPYGTTACKWDSVLPLEFMWHELKRVTKDNGAIVMTASQPFTTTLIASNMKMFKYCWVWIKTRATGHLNAKKRPMKSTEDIVVFYADKTTYNPQGLVYKSVKVMNSKSHSLRGKDNKTSTVSGGIRHEEYTQEYTNYPRQHLEVASESKPVHPTQKPLALMEYLIKTYTNEGETVLDFTMGRGTTGVAAKRLNMNFVGIEPDHHYFNIAKERISESKTEQSDESR